MSQAAWSATGDVTVEEVGWFPVEDASTGAIAKRAVVESALQLGLAEARVGELAIAAAEIASNLHKHADDGTMLVRRLRRHGVGGVEVVALDRGPGMADPALSSRDGYSTTNTLGIGLGAIARLASRWDLYSLPGRGTVLAARFWPDGPSGPPRPADAMAAADGITRPITGEAVSGDLYAVRPTATGHLLLLSDGLGHGVLAAAASMAAVGAFLAGEPDGPAAMVARLHARLNHTRGAAVGIAALDRAAGSVRFAGLGNVSAHVVRPGQRQSMVTVPGIAGHGRRAVREFAYPLAGDALVVMHSDGVRDAWDLDDYPGLVMREPLTVAATLLRDAGGRRDDAGVLVAKAAGDPP